MPWTPGEATKHTEKATTPKLQEMWARIANNALRNCLAKDKPRDECEASAIRVANDAVNKATAKTGE
jgi:hypothetical protein